MKDQTPLMMTNPTTRSWWSLAVICVAVIFMFQSNAVTTFADSYESIPLATEEEVDWLNKNPIGIRNAISAVNPGQSETETLKKVARLQVLKMSIPQYDRELSDIRERLKRDLNLLAKPAARSIMLPELVDHAQKLLTDQPYDVRLNACRLLTELNQQPPQIARRIEAVPFLGMAEPLLFAVNDRDQHPAVKITACLGLRRLCEFGDPKVALRTKIADAMIAELNQPKIHPWYQRILVQSVSFTNVLKDKRNKPYIVQKLAETLVDQNLPWAVRAEAAAGLGRTEMDGSVNVPLIAHEIVRFAHEFGLAYNKALNAPHWRYTAFRTYTAFKPEKEHQEAFLTRIQSLPLSQFRQEITGAYENVLPISNGITKHPPKSPRPIDTDILEKAQEWLDGNKPASYAVTPNSEPIRKG